MYEDNKGEIDLEGNPSDSSDSKNIYWRNQLIRKMAANEDIPLLCLP